MKLNNQNKINKNMKDNSKNNGDSIKKENYLRYGVKSNKFPWQVKGLIALLDFAK